MCVCIFRWEQKYGPIPPNSLVLVRSGWGSRWPDTRLFRGEKDLPEQQEMKGDSEVDAKQTVKLDNNLHFPG